MGARPCFFSWNVQENSVKLKHLHLHFLFFKKIQTCSWHVLHLFNRVSKGLDVFPENLRKWSTTLLPRSSETLWEVSSRRYTPRIFYLRTPGIADWCGLPWQDGLKDYGLVIAPYNFEPRQSLDSGNGSNERRSTVVLICKDVVYVDYFHVFGSIITLLRLSRSCVSCSVCSKCSYVCVCLYGEFLVRYVKNHEIVASLFPHVSSVPLVSGLQLLFHKIRDLFVLSVFVPFRCGISFVANQKISNKKNANYSACFFFTAHSLSRYWQCFCFWQIHSSTRPPLFPQMKRWDACAGLDDRRVHHRPQKEASQGALWNRFGNDNESTLKLQFPIFHENHEFRTESNNLLSSRCQLTNKQHIFFYFFWFFFLKKKQNIHK